MGLFFFSPVYHLYIQIPDQYMFHVSCGALQPERVALREAHCMWPP